jgi:hypothetical protein
VPSRFVKARAEGNEIAVYRFHKGKIAQVWFYVEPDQQEVFSQVFACE